MNIATFEPWNLLNVIPREARSLDTTRSRIDTVKRATTRSANWTPAVDIIEEQTRFVLRADVPGLKADDINIDMEKGVLNVSGQREEARKEDTETVQLRERSSGKFARRFTLPEAADAEGITAMCADGILEIVIPKQAAVEARRIAVKAA